MTDTTPSIAPAQVGNGRSTHYVRTDGFHLKAIGCNRTIDRILDERAAKKMTATCKACAKAIEELPAAPETVEAPPTVTEARDIVAATWPQATEFHPHLGEGGAFLGYTFRADQRHRYGWVTAAGTYSRSPEVYRDSAASLLPVAAHDEAREGVIVKHDGAADGSAPRDAAHPDVAAAREALAGLKAARLTDRHDVCEPTEEERDVRGYMIDPRGGGRVALYWLEDGQTVRRDTVDGTALDCLAGRMTRCGWTIERMLRSSRCVFAHRPADSSVTREPYDVTTYSMTATDVTRSDGITVRQDGRAPKYIVSRGHTVLGVLFDDGPEMRRGQYSAWSPYATGRGQIVGYYSDPAEAVEAIVRTWPAPAPDDAESAGAAPQEPRARLSAPATASEPEPEHCTPLTGGKVHEVMPDLGGPDGRAGDAFPLCRTGGMSSRGTQYRTVTAELTCPSCITYRDRRRARAEAARAGA